MTQYMMSARLHEFESKFYRRDFWQKYQIGSKKSLFLLVALIIIFSFFYLWQINSLATKGYKVKELEDRVSELRETNKKLELQITELRSSDRITKEVENLQMVQVARVEYLRPDGTAVALNR
jgi:cell division protein FtsL